jgi:hypothetical protein
MAVKFANDIDGLKRISGNGSEDIGIATFSANEMEKFVEAQAQIIKDYASLRSILTTASEVEIKDAITSMEHVVSALSDLASFHGNGLLGGTFDAPRFRAKQVLDEAKQKATALIGKIFR